MPRESVHSYDALPRLSRHGRVARVTANPRLHASCLRGLHDHWATSPPGAEPSRANAVIYSTSRARRWELREDGTSLLEATAAEVDASVRATPAVSRHAWAGRWVGSRWHPARQELARWQSYRCSPKCRCTLSPSYRYIPKCSALLSQHDAFGGSPEVSHEGSLRIFPKCHARNVPLCRALG
jgi:hypothetical protein